MVVADSFIVMISLDSALQQQQQQHLNLPAGKVATAVEKANTKETGHAQWINDERKMLVVVASWAADYLLKASVRFADAAFSTKH